MRKIPLGSASFDPVALRSSMMRSMCRPPSSTAWPSRVIRAGFTRRSSRGVFSVASRRWICRVTADGVRNSRSAARCNEPDSARTTNVRISSSMTEFQLPVEQYDSEKVELHASARHPPSFRPQRIPYQRTSETPKAQIDEYLPRDGPLTGDHLDFDLRIQRQRGDGDSGASWIHTVAIANGR